MEKQSLVIPRSEATRNLLFAVSADCQVDDYLCRKIEY